MYEIITTSAWKRVYSLDSCLSPQCIQPGLVLVDLTKDKKDPHPQLDSLAPLQAAGVTSPAVKLTQVLLPALSITRVAPRARWPDLKTEFVA